jgi:Lar family restriction alleviation protein
MKTPFAAAAMPATYSLTGTLAKLCAYEPRASVLECGSPLPLSAKQPALPCPFCGDHQNLIVSEGEPPRYQWIDCGSCGAEGPRADTFAGQTAVSLWNRRRP